MRSKQPVLARSTEKAFYWSMSNNKYSAK